MITTVRFLAAVVAAMLMFSCGGDDVGGDDTGSDAGGGVGGGAEGEAGAGGHAGTDAGTARDAGGGSGGAGGAVDGGGVGGLGGLGGAGGTGGTAGGPACGNGILEGNEQCDDGNGVDLDACLDGLSGLCQNAACGDGMLRRDLASTDVGYEQCDDGNNADGDGCDANCQFEGNCGDGNQDANEECDLGAANDDNASGSCPAVCRTSCRCPACGDGVVDFVLGEECDDLNQVDGDGCSSSCTKETINSCGNGRLDIDQNEECDDGNVANGDGCDDTCQYEPVGGDCGDGTTDTLEKCDDGNVANGDGCNPTCNLNTTVTTLATGIDGDALAVDDTYLWIAGCAGWNASGPIDPCQIQRIDIDDCLQNGNCTPIAVVGGNCGAPLDAQGASAVMGCSGSLTTDGNTVWFEDRHTIRAVDVQTMNVTTVAGDTALCAAIDGQGSSALFHDIRGLTYYNGYIYLLDACEQVLRRLDPNTGTVVTIAGQRIPSPNVPQTGPNQYQCQSGWNCTDGMPTDGQGTGAVFGSPRYMTADHSGNLYITDTNGEAIRTYNIVTGWVGTIIGGAQGYVDGTGAAVRLDRPRGMTSDGTSVYWAEQNQHTVRQVIIQTAEASTLAAVRGCPGSADGTGADATQDWSGNCQAGALNGLPRIDTPFGGIAFHFPSRSIFLLESGRLRRIE